MKSIVIFSLLVLFASEVAFSQNAEAHCPKLTIVGPQGITNAGEDLSFKVEFTGKVELRNLDFEWTVVGGELIEGQGARRVRVSTKSILENNLEYAEVVAQIKVDGLPVGCERIATESANVIGRIGHRIPSDEWADLEPEDEKGRLDVFFVELQNNPSHAGFIILFIGKDGKREDGLERIRRIIEHSNYREFDKSRLEFAISKDGEYKRTELWRIPDGADYPSCGDCEIIKGRFQ